MTEDKWNIDEIEEKLKGTMGWCRRIENRITEVEQYKNPLTFENRFVELENNVGDFMPRFKVAEAKIKKLEAEAHVNITDDELKTLYKSCALGIEELASHMKCGTTMAYKYANGEVSDVIVRSRVKDFLLENQAVV